MPSSYSPNLKIELIAVGEQTDAWGSTTNDNFENVLEEAITGMTTAIFPLDADYDWAATYVNSVTSQPQRNLVVEVIGTISVTRNFIVPTIEKQYLVYNNTIGGQDIVVKTFAGTGITVPNGQRAHLFVDGSDVLAVVNYFPTLRAGAATLDTPLPVASGGTGSTSLATITVGTATNIAGGGANQIPYNTGAGATSFIAAPTISSTYLQWNGSALVWAALPATVSSFSAGTTGLTPNTATTGAVTLAGTLNIANGGTGATTAQLAINALAGATTSGQYLRGNGANVVMSAIQAADVPTLNQNTTGNAATATTATNVAGGTANQIVYNTGAGATSFVAAPTVASTYLQWNGTAFAWATVTGGVTTFSGGATGLTPATATSGAITLAGTLAVANGGTGSTTSTGTGSVVLSNSPSLTTPTIGVATATSINKVTVTAPATSATLTIANGVTFAVNKSITLTNGAVGAVTYTLPSSTSTIPAVSSNNTWTGTNQFSGSTSINNMLCAVVNLTNYGFVYGIPNDPIFPSLTSGDRNIVLGAITNTITSGSNNVAIGSSIINDLTSGSHNIVIGSGTAQNLSNGSDNVILGKNSAITMSSGTANVIIGRDVGATLNGSDKNVFIGDSAGNFLASGNANIFLGSAAGGLPGGSYNIAIGQDALLGLGGINVVDQIAIGTGAGYGISGSPNPNVMIGSSAADGITTGGRNTIVGPFAGRAVDAGNNNTYIGCSAGEVNSYNNTNVSCIGYQAEPSASSVSNEFTLGNSSIATLRCQVTTITSLSDARDKTNIVDIPIGLDFIKLIRPVSFDWNMRDGGKIGVPEFGFIAQQLLEAQSTSGVTVPNLVSSTNPDRLEAGPGTLLPVLVKAIQELSAQVDALKAELAALRG